MSNVVPKKSYKHLSLRLAFTLAIGAGLPAAMAQAQTAGVPLQFPLEPGDVLAVAVANHPEMSASNLIVAETGKIPLPVVGSIAVAGKTLPQVQGLVARAYRRELLHPSVTVTVVQPKPRTVLVTGAVGKAGAVPVEPGWRVSDAIAATGGITAPTEEIVATLQRGRDNVVPLNLTSINNSVLSEDNLAVRPGDLLKFDLIPGRVVNVTGDVKGQGQVSLRRGRRLVDAIVAANGLVQTPETTQVTLLRGGTRTNLNVQGAFEAPGGPDNIELKQGDALVVKAIRSTVSVVSFADLVKSPGVYTLDGRPTVLRALLAAGGPTVAPQQVISTIRRGEQSIPVDLEKASYDPKFDLPMRDGDVLLLNPPPGPAVEMAGSIVRSGQVRLPEGGTLLDAIVAAGGLSLKPTDVRVAVLRKMGDRTVVMNADPVALVSLHDLSQNVRLQTGDLVMVNPKKAANTVYVDGEVGNPGAFEANETDGLMEVILRAGGPTDFASLKRVRLVRKEQAPIEVDLSHAADATAAPVKIPLQEGDMVYVPRNPNQVLVMNAVAKPGYYPIPENGRLTIGDAILAAGGARDRARLQNVALVRRLANGEVEKRIVPVNQVANGNMTIDVVLAPGDIVYVPEGKTSSSGLKSTLGILGTVGALSRYLR